MSLCITDGFYLNAQMFSYDVVQTMLIYLIKLINNFNQLIIHFFSHL